jgi:lipid-binding SYLF domain-containing protein
MSANKIWIFLLSSVLIFGTALAVPAQSTTPPQDQTTQKQTTTHRAVLSKDEIRNAQQALKDKGLYTGPVDGTMNADTQKALREFQQNNNLKVTGTLNHRTMNTLGLTTSTPKKEKGHRQTSGLSKDNVRGAQMALKNDGFDPGPIDGVLGPRTMTALRNYQSHYGLEVTGTLTAETRKQLMGTASASRNKPEAPIQSATDQSTAVAASREQVREAQRKLASLMYNPGDINGMMTSQTRQAVREFQYLNNLPVTGNLDEQTMSAIDSQASGTSPYSSSVRRHKPVATVPQQTAPATTTDQNTSKSGHHHSSGKVDKDYSERVQKAVDVLEDLTGTPDKKIPNELLERSEAIAVIPNVYKGAFGIGGRFGKGVISSRLDNGHWSAPSFLNIGGGSFGAQIGVSSTDLVLVFTDRNALKLLEGGKDLKLGADASIVAGPVGRTAEAGVNLNLKTGIYAYSRAKGLFAGVALDGAVLDIDNSANEKVYGASADATEILSGKIPSNPTVQPFVTALERNVPVKKISQK